MRRAVDAALGFASDDDDEEEAPGSLEEWSASFGVLGGPPLDAADGFVAADGGRLSAARLSRSVCDTVSVVISFWVGVGLFLSLGMSMMESDL